MLGSETMENAIPLGVLERCRGRFPMSAIARTLGIARCNLMEGPPHQLRAPYHKREDADLLADVKLVIGKRPTYGYRRATAVNKRLPIRNPGH